MNQNECDRICDRINSNRSTLRNALHAYQIALDADTALAARIRSTIRNRFELFECDFDAALAQYPIN